MNSGVLDALTKAQETWSYLGSGDYNHVYRSTGALTIDGVSGPWVLKMPKALSDDDLNEANRASRAEAIFRSIYPESPVFYTDGYRLRVIKENEPSDEVIQEQKGIVFLYHTSHDLIAAFMEVSGHVERIVLNDKLGSEVAANIIEDIKQSDKKLGDDMLLENQRLIFQALGFLRECLILPYFGDIKAKSEDIVKEVINIYKNTGLIILDAEIEGNFLELSDGSIRCIDVDMAYLRGSPVSEKNISEWIDVLDAEPTPVVETLMYLEEALGDQFIGNRLLLDHPLFPELIIKLCSIREDSLEEDQPISVNILTILLTVIGFRESGLIFDEDITPELIARLDDYDKRGISIDCDLVKQVMDGGDKRRTLQFYKPVESTHEKKRARVEETASSVSTSFF